MHPISRIVWMLLVVGTLLGFHATAGAITIGVGGSVSFDNGSGLTGSITWVSKVTGAPAGAMDVQGVIGGTDDTFLFKVSVDGGASDNLDNLTIGAFTMPGPVILSRTAAGWVPNGGVDVSNVSFVADTSKFDFGAGVGPGSMSDHFFVSFAAGDAPPGTFFNFTTGPLGSNGTTSVQLPEPASWLLLGLGVGGLSVLRRRRSAR